MASAQVGSSLSQISESDPPPESSPAAPAEAPPVENEESAPVEQTSEAPVSSDPAPPTESKQPSQAPAPQNAPPSAAPVPAPTGPDPDQSTVEEEKQKPASPYNTLIILEGVAKYGLIGRGTDLLESDQNDPFDEKFSVGYLGLQATLGLMPARSAFTLAGRLRGGAYLGHPPAMGSMGAAMLFGANFARSENGRSFSYALGGLGVEFLPTDSQDMLTVHASGGTVINEFTLGAGLDFGINNEVFIATFGLQIGWARML